MPSTDRNTEFAGRQGRYVLLRDRDGLRHAVRGGSILAISDVDGGEVCTAVILHGGRIIIVDAPIEEILAWLD